MIQVTNLHKSFRGQQVLRGVNLEFATGKITTIVGTSGCGKTVLLKHLNALYLPDAGEVFVDGVDITKLRQKELYEVRSKFGVLFQGAALLDSLNVFDNVAFPLREKTSMTESDIKKKVDEPLGAGRPGQHGQQIPRRAERRHEETRRIGAGAGHRSRQIVLFDEPTTGLDPVLATSIHQLIARTQNEFGYTGIIVSHTIPQVFEISDYIAMLAGGIIENMSPPAEFCASANPVVQQFIHGKTEGPIQVL